jgi:hypothetical protein
LKAVPLDKSFCQHARGHHPQAEAVHAWKGICAGLQPWRVTGSLDTGRLVQTAHAVTFDSPEGLFQSTRKTITAR